MENRFFKDSQIVIAGVLIAIAMITSSTFSLKAFFGLSLFKDVEKISRISRQVTELIPQGVELISESSARGRNRFSFRQ